MVTSVSRGARVAAAVLCAGFAAIAVVHLAWAVGVTWGLDAASGGLAKDSSIGLSVASLLVVVLCCAAILVTGARVGWWETRLSDHLVHVGAWIIFAALALAVLMNVGAKTNWERFGNSAIALVLAIAALAVARSHAPPRTSGRRQGPVTRTPLAH